MKKAAILIIILVMMVLYTGCSGKKDKPDTDH